MQAALRALASRDVDEALAHYRAQAGPEVAAAFVEELEAALAHLCRHPQSGALRFAHEVDIPGLRNWSLQRFPYIVFYMPEDEHIDVWRILHARRDIPDSLRPQEPA